MRTWSVSVLKMAVYELIIRIEGAGHQLNCYLQGDVSTKTPQ